MNARESLFSLIDPRADWHMENWRRWMRSCEAGKGYPHKSAGLASGGSAGGEEFDCMCEEADRHAAKVSDSIIDGLKLLDQRYPLAIWNVYLGRVWTYRGDPKTLFIEAADIFWRRAQRAGLS